MLVVVEDDTGLAIPIIELELSTVLVAVAEETGNKRSPDAFIDSLD